MTIVCANNVNPQAQSQAQGHDDAPTPYHGTRAAHIPNTDPDVFADTSNVYHAWQETHDFRDNSDDESRKPQKWCCHLSPRTLVWSENTRFSICNLNKPETVEPNKI